MDEVHLWIAKMKIHELLGEYTLAIDRHDPEGWANCFTPDGVFGTGNLAIRGRAKLSEYAKVHSTINTRHITASPVYVVEAGGQRATGQATTVVTAATRAGNKILMIGHYDDQLVNVDGRWLIAQRWAPAEGPAEDPSLDGLSADEEVSTMIRRLFDAFERLGERV